MTKFCTRINLLQHVFRQKIIQPKKNALVMVCKIVVAVVMSTVFFILFKVDHAVDVGWHVGVILFVLFKLVEIVLHQNANVGVIHVHTCVGAGGGMIEVKCPLGVHKRHPTKQVLGTSANWDVITISPVDV
jgi:hypothetical protein